MNKILLSILLITGLIITSAYLPNPSQNEVPYPEGYRNWTHIKSMILEKGHPLYEAFGGIHHIYANKKALEGYRAGNKFKDGSIIVFDLLEALSDNNAITEGNRKVVGVMVKDSKNSKILVDGVLKDLRVTLKSCSKNMEGECFACHQQVKDKDFVFSEYRK